MLTEEQKNNQMFDFDEIIDEIKQMDEKQLKALEKVVVDGREDAKGSFFELAGQIRQMDEKQRKAIEQVIVDTREEIQEEELTY